MITEHTGKVGFYNEMKMEKRRIARKKNNSCYWKLVYDINIK